MDTCRWATARDWRQRAGGRFWQSLRDGVEWPFIGLCLRSNWVGDGVTHWMPLPQPPGECRMADDIDRLRLTAEERQAIAWVCGDVADITGPTEETLRGLLERTKETAHMSDENNRPDGSVVELLETIAAFFDQTDRFKGGAIPVVSPEATKARVAFLG